VDRRLTRRRLPHATLEHVAHDHFFDGAVLDSRTPHGFTDDERTEFGGAEGQEPAEILADGGADGT